LSEDLPLIDNEFLPRVGFLQMYNAPLERWTMLGQTGGVRKSFVLWTAPSIRVAQTHVIDLVGLHALAVRRFDREGGQRVHSISAGTAIRAASAPGF